MSNKDIKAEFKDFIKELTVEICTNVCLDKITTVNEEFKKNNLRFKDTTNKVEQILFDNKKNVELINTKNNSTIKSISDELKNTLYENEKELEELYGNNVKKFEETLKGFKELFERALNNEENKEENNEMVVAIAKELMGSHDALDEAMDVVNKSNKEHLESLKKSNEELLQTYEAKIQKLNKEERDKFIKELSHAISSQKDSFSKDVIVSIEKFTSETMKQFTGKTEIYVEKMNKLINDNSSNKKLKDLIDNINKISNRIEQLNTEIKKVDKNVDSLERKISSRYSELSKEILSDISKQNSELINSIKK